MRSLFEHFRVRKEDVQEPGSLLFDESHFGSIPLRGVIADPLLKEEEYEKCPTRPIARVKVFDLKIPEQLSEYELILHRIVNGWYSLLHRQFSSPEGRAEPIVYMEWVEMYKDLPNGLPLGRG